MYFPLFVYHRFPSIFTAAFPFFFSLPHQPFHDSLFFYLFYYSQGHIYLLFLYLSSFLFYLLFATIRHSIFLSLPLFNFFQSRICSSSLFPTFPSVSFSIFLASLIPFQPFFFLLFLLHFFSFFLSFFYITRLNSFLSFSVSNPHSSIPTLFPYTFFLHFLFLSSLSHFNNSFLPFFILSVFLSYPALSGKLHSSDFFLPFKLSLFFLHIHSSPTFSVAFLFIISFPRL